MFVSDLLHLGTPILPRSVTRSRPLFPVFGMCRPVLSLSIMDLAHIEAILSSHFCAWLEPSVSALDFLHLGPMLSSRAFAYLGSAISALGLACIDLVFSPPVLDLVHFGLMMLIRSLACVALSIPALGHTHTDSLMLLQSST